MKPEARIAVSVLAAALIISAALMLRNASITGFAAVRPQPAGQQAERIVIESGSSQSIDLSRLFASSGRQMTFVLTAAKDIAVQVDGSILSVVPDPGFAGERVITVYASDGNGVHARRIRIEVVPQRRVEKIEDAVEAALEEAGTVQVIAILKDDSRPWSAGQGRRIALEQRRAKIAALRSEVLSGLDAGQQITGAAVADAVQPIEITRQYDTINAIALNITPEGLRRLRNDPDVAQVVLDREFSVSLSESVPLIDADDAWNSSLNGIGVGIAGANGSICIIDTGIDIGHPAFAGRIVGGRDFVNNDDVPQDDSSNSHGTHVAGIIAGNGAGITGVAPGALVVPVKVCSGSGSCSASNILAGIDYCNNNSAAFNITVLSGSLGDNLQHSAADCPTFFDSALNVSAGLGIIPVFASGNNGFVAGINYPACSLFAISAGSSSKSDIIDSFTNRGDRLDVLAPGSSITSAAIGGGTRVLSGTSMAAPHVSGAVALVQEAQKAIGRPLLSVSEMRELLKQAGKQVSQWNRIDVLAALIRLGRNYSVNLTDHSVTNITLPRAIVRFNGSVDLSRAALCARLHQNLVEIDSVQCPELNASAHILLEGISGVNATPLRNGLACPADVCTNAFFSNSTLEFDVSGFTNYSGRGIEPAGSVCSSCSGCTVCAAVVGSVCTLAGPVAASGDCISITAANVVLNCSSAAITGNGSGTGIAAGINSTISGCIVSGFEAAVSAGNGTLVENSSIVNNAFGLVLSNTASASARQNEFRNNSIALLANSSDDNFFSGNFQGTAWLQDSLGNTFSNAFAGLILENTSAGAGIRYAGINITSGARLSDFVSISENRIFVNSTALPALNASARISLKETGFVSPAPVFDPEDDGVFAACPADVCTAQEFVNDVFAFNVTHFTSFAAAESGIAVLLSKDSQPDPVNSSGLLNYTIIVNVSTGTAENLTIRENYPLQAVFVSSQPLPVAGTNSTFFIGDIENIIVAVNITVAFSGVYENAIINNTAVASFINSTGRLQEIAVTETTSVIVPGQGFSNLSVIKKGSPAIVNISSNIIYVINVTSTGNSRANNVTVVEAYPGQAAYVSAQPVPSSGNDTWLLGSLEPGSEVLVNITMLALSADNGAVINNSVSITFSDESVNVSSASASEQTVIQNIPVQPQPSGGSSSGGSGGGGGGSGGSSQASAVSAPMISVPGPAPAASVVPVPAERLAEKECIEDWSCEDWSECLEGMQSRRCNDLNNCGTTGSMPDIARLCSLSAQEPVPLLNEPVRPGRAIGIAISTLLLALALVALAYIFSSAAERLAKKWLVVFNIIAAAELALLVLSAAMYKVVEAAALVLFILIVLFVLLSRLSAHLHHRKRK